MTNIIETLSATLFFGTAITLIGFAIGMLVKKKFNFSILNPLVVAMILIILFLKLTGISYDTYNEGAKYISYFLTPATVCLAVPLYEKLQLLKDNFLAVILGILSGIASNALMVWGICILYNLDKTVFATMLPKSITTAIGMVLSKEAGGLVNITVAMIVITGIVGNVMAELILKLIKVKEPVARGIAIGTSSHVLGTSKAVEMGEIEGAMSGLAVAVSGIITVVVVPVLVGLY